MRGRRPGLRRAPPAEQPQPQQQRPGLAGPGEAMLPWKRHKFELAAAGDEKDEEEQEEKRKPPPQRRRPPGQPPSAPAAVPGKAAAAAAGASLGSGPLSRVGRLFRSRRQKFRVSSEAPTYTVLYLGNATTLQAKGEGCTDAAVGKIWAKSEAGRLGTKMRLTIGPQGIRMAPAAASAAAPEAARPPGHLYLLHRVTYCAADARLPRLFAWVYRHEVKHKAVLLRCHAALASKAEKARAMALLLYQTSAAALAEFRRLKKRADARRQQLQQLQQAGQSPGAPGVGGPVPLVPLRRLLAGAPGGPGAAACCYKPPVERSRGAPRLGAIAEDALGEELEARADQREAEEERLKAPGGGGAAAGAPGLGRLIRGLGGLGIGNDGALLRADRRVTGLRSGESIGSDGPEPDTG